MPKMMLCFVYYYYANNILCKEWIMVNIIIGVANDSINSMVLVVYYAAQVLVLLLFFKVIEFTETYINLHITIIR